MAQVTIIAILFAPLRVWAPKEILWSLADAGHPDERHERRLKSVRFVYPD
ncbi:hypothetical protein [Paracoccus sp. SSJ]|nr:hypothetical protein [Paracoccus sp. SSJ]MDK8873413.1 hypothetical protein [Paracoccus sp. SSJ]